MSSIAIIPARGGSKRIPRKNIRVFHGKPMIVWSIQAALESNVFDKVIVSTDDDEVASIAQAAGALVPFQRPRELSGDHAATMPVVAHAIGWWQENCGPLDFGCCVYATAPFLRPASLVESIRMLRTTDAEFVLSVGQFRYPVQRSLRLDGLGKLNFAEPENAFKRSQDLETRYHDAGQFFAGRVEALMTHESVLFGQCLPLIVPEDEVIDIDNDQDWRLAEKLYSIWAR